MKRWLPLLALVISCGDPAGSESQIPFSLLIDRAAFDQIASFQVSVVSNGNAAIPDCAAEQKKCLVDQVARAQLAALQTFPKALDGGIQAVSVSGIPAGKNYALVVEAISNAAPPTLVGSSCSYLQEITAGVNKPVLATITTDAGVACDPRFDK